MGLMGGPDVRGPRSIQLWRDGLLCGSQRSGSGERLETKWIGWTRLLPQELEEVWRSGDVRFQELGKPKPEGVKEASATKPTKNTRAKEAL